MISPPSPSEGVKKQLSLIHTIYSVEYALTVNPTQKTKFQ
jgi:hypothetical protein